MACGLLIGPLTRVPHPHPAASRLSDLLPAASGDEEDKAVAGTDAPAARSASQTVPPEAAAAPVLWLQGEVLLELQGPLALSSKPEARCACLPREMGRAFGLLITRVGVLLSRLEVKRTCSLARVAHPGCRTFHCYLLPNPSHMFCVALRCTPPPRCAAALWLVSLLAYCRDAPALTSQSTLASLQSAFTALLGDSNELTQVGHGSLVTRASPDASVGLSYSCAAPQH
jgi:hypothetical protein